MYIAALIGFAVKNPLLKRQFFSVLQDGNLLSDVISFSIKKIRC
jgi:hypothetical protein